MTVNGAPHGSSTTANRPKGVSCAGVSTLPPLASMAVTVSSADATAKHVVQPAGAPGSRAPRPPSGRSAVRNVV